MSNAPYDETTRNIAVVGCGYWGKNLVRNFGELGALHTTCDTNTETLERITQLFPGTNAENEYLRVLDNSEIKGVVIATPAVSHYSMAKQALLAGKDTFVEKPLSMAVAEGRELVELAQKKHCVLMVGHILEYHPAVTRLKESVDQGELGEIQYIYSNRLKLGKFRDQENVLWSLAPHDISVILLLLGNTMPRQVSAHGGCYLRPGVTDVALSTLSFDHGVEVYVFVSWLHPFSEQRLVIVGDKAMMVFDDTNPREKLYYYNHPIEWIDQEPVPLHRKGEMIEVTPAEPLKIECQDFVQCIKSRRKPKADGNKGLQVLKVLSCCQNSLQGDGISILLSDEDNQ